METIFTDPSLTSNHTSNRWSSKLIFDDRDLPATVVILCSDWCLGIANSVVLGQYFDATVIQAVVRGEPRPAEQVYSLLSHWISECADQNVIRHTYALRLRLDAYIYEYALARQRVDELVWNLLGLCSIGREMALRLDVNLNLNLTAPWQLVILMDWVEIKSTGSIRCVLDTQGSRISIILQPRMFDQSLIVFPTVDAHLWPITFPVIDSTVLHTHVAQGEALNLVVDTLIANNSFTSTTWSV